MNTKAQSGKGGIRLLGTLVWANRPWRLVPHLTGALAAATGTAAYVTITSSFWSMSNSLSPWRLALINTAAIVGMVAWLVIRNNLWERPQKRSDRGKASLYNASTVVTLFIGVACMYAILYVVTLIAALVAIDSNYLGSELKNSGGFSSYATLVWLASSVGIVAGALGSSFDSEEAVRKATYSKRELERQHSV